MKRFVVALMMISTPAAAKPACDELAGSVMFSDMMYGLIGGTILSGLYLVAADDKEHVGRKVAGGALGAAAIGAGVGVMELALRDCPSTHMRMQGSNQRLRPLVTASNKQVVGGFSFHW